MDNQKEIKLQFREWAKRNKIQLGYGAMYIGITRACFYNWLNGDTFNLSEDKISLLRDLISKSIQ